MEFVKGNKCKEVHRFVDDLMDEWDALNGWDLRWCSWWDGNLARWVASRCYMEIMHRFRVKDEYKVLNFGS